jgi:hypothetical protein
LLKGVNTPLNTHLFVLGYGVHGTILSTGAAFDALLGINLVVFLAHINASHGAVIRTRSARNAIIADFVCHYQPSKIIYPYRAMYAAIVTQMEEKSIIFF